jgi:putative MATE family efflux protein
MPIQISAKDVLKLAWPEFFIQLIMVLASITEMFFIGKSGIIAVSGAVIGNIVISLINNFLGECEAASRSLAAKYLGAQSHREISQTFLMSIVIPAVLGLIVVLFSPLISFLSFYLVGNSDVNSIGGAYIYTLLKVVPFSLIFFSLGGFMNGMGDMLSPLYIRIIMHSFNVLLDFVLIFGFFGFPKFGIQGVAIASICTYFLGSVLSIFVIFRKKYVDAKFSLKIIKETFWGKLDIFKSYLKISCNVGFQFGFCDLAMYILALIIERSGVNALATHQVAYYQIYLALQLPIYGFYVACSVIIGKLFGANLYNEIVPNMLKICKIVLFLSSVCVSVVFFGASFWVSIFSSANSDTVSTISFVTRLLCLNLIVDSLYVVISGGLLGADDSRFVMMEGILSEYLLLLPLSYFLSSTYGMGLVGIYFAFCIRTFVNLLIVGWRFFVFREWNKTKPAQEGSPVFLPAYFKNYSVQIAVQYFVDEDIFIPNNRHLDNVEQK